MNNKKIIIMHLIIVIMVTIAVGCTKETTWTEIDNMPTPQDSIKDDENQIDKEDIFIKNHPLLKNTPFYSTTIDDINENFPEPLYVTSSEESADGHFIYYQGDGIIYITDSNGWLYSIILTLKSLNSYSKPIFAQIASNVMT